MAPPENIIPLFFEKGEVSSYIRFNVLLHIPFTDYFSAPIDGAVLDDPRAL